MHVKRPLLLMASALLLAGCSLLPQESEAPPVSVAAPTLTQREVTAVRLGAVESRLSLTASFGAEKQTPLYFRSNGRLKKLHVTPGQKVATGQKLAELESGSTAYDLASAELDLETAGATLERAKSRAGFTDAPSEGDMQRYETEVKKAELKLQRQREMMADTAIYAPFAGQVVNVAANEGDQADAYKEVLSLAADGRVVARIPIDEANAAKIQPGMRAEIFPNDGDPTAVKGQVISVPPVGSNAKDRIVVIVPDAPSKRLTVGRNARAEVFLQAKTDALIVPLSAVRTFGGRKFVTVVKGETRQEVAVETGIVGDKYVEILSGVQAGDQVVSR
jgi:RND family efflux transporter MFP subunit